MPPHVGGNEPRVRVAGKQTVTLGHHLFEARVSICRQPSVRTKRQLQPSLVQGIDGLVELGRLTHMDQDGNPQSGARLKDRVELSVVNRHALALLVTHGNPKILEEL